MSRDRRHRCLRWEDREADSRLKPLVLQSLRRPKLRKKARRRRRAALRRKVPKRERLRHLRMERALWQKEKRVQRRPDQQGKNLKTGQRIRVLKKSDPRRKVTGTEDQRA